MNAHNSIRDLYAPIAAATGLAWLAHRALPSHTASIVSLSIVGMLGLHLLFSFTRFMIGLAIFAVMIKVLVFPFPTYIQTFIPKAATPAPAQAPQAPKMHPADPDDFEGTSVQNALSLAQPSRPSLR